MSLWIRSQDREGLLKVDTIDMEAETTSNGSILEGIYETVKTGRYFILANKYRVGVYGTKGQALEILNEIQNLLTGKLILKTNNHLKAEDLFRLKNEYERINNEQFITQDDSVEIKQLATGDIIYEMP